MILRSLALSISFILLATLAAPARSTGFEPGARSLTGQSSSQSKPAPPPPPPQDPAQDQDVAVRLSSRLVMVPVSASDAAGQPVKDLQPEDVVIEEEGRPQKVVALGE